MANMVTALAPLPLVSCPLHRRSLFTVRDELIQVSGTCHKLSYLEIAYTMCQHWVWFKYKIARHSD